MQNDKSIREIKRELWSNKEKELYAKHMKEVREEFSENDFREGSEWALTVYFSGFESACSELDKYIIRNCMDEYAEELQVLSLWESKCDLAAEGRKELDDAALQNAVRELGFDIGECLKQNYRLLTTNAMETIGKDELLHKAIEWMKIHYF